MVPGWRVRAGWPFSGATLVRMRGLGSEVTRRPALGVCGERLRDRVNRKSRCGVAQSHRGKTPTPRARAAERRSRC